MTATRHLNYRIEILYVLDSVLRTLLLYTIVCVCIVHGRRLGHQPPNSSFAISLIIPSINHPTLYSCYMYSPNNRIKILTVTIAILQARHSEHTGAET